MADSSDPGEPERSRGEPDPTESQLGPAPAVANADRLRAALRARMFGDAPDDDDDDGKGDDDGDSTEDSTEPAAAEGDEAAEDFGPAPKVVGAGRMRADLRARLFGSSDDDDDDDDEHRDRAARSGVIGKLPTLDGEAAVARKRVKHEPPVASSIGRFRVLDRLGSGGMGVVYSAYDPELDRKVAIKLLRPDVRQGMEARDAEIRLLGDESQARLVRDAQARLLREAQAMARLSDPNVIVVHEVGSVDDGVFVAMEFIDGVTLGTFIEDRSRPWAEVLDVFIKAGSGLAAAHRADLVHRDFKPENVLLGGEGQVRVLDFGLARSMAGDEARPTISPPSLRERPELDTLGTPLTRTGAVMGTPAYMSPEQYLGHAADARSDQFSFCVALYEGLYGVRPFEGNTLAILSDNVIGGHIRTTPSDAKVPKRMLTVLRRGLSPKPADRYPSMEALLAELRRDPARKWRWGGVVLGVGVMTSVVTWAATGGDDAAEACVGLERQLEGVWDDAARAEVTGAIEGTGLDYAPRVAATTVQLLDDYTSRWVSMAADACGAALVAQDDDESEHLRRQLCLDQRLAEVDALVDALREPDSGMAEAAVKATASLTTELSSCADPRRLAAYDITDDPAVRKRQAQAHAKLARAKSQGVLGHYEQAVTLATEVIEEARATEAETLEALGLLARGTYRERTDDPKQSEADLRAAISLAERNGDPGTRAQALIVLIYVIAQDRTRYVEARLLGDQARAVLEYIDADPLLLADLDSSLGVAAHNEGDFDAALKMHRRSHQRRVDVLGEDHPDIGRTLLNIGVSMKSSREHLAQAEEYFRRALESLEPSLGPRHPLVGTALTNLGNCVARQGRLEEAMPLQRRALEIFEAAFGPEHLATTQAMFNLGRIMLKTDRPQEAAVLFRRGLEARERELAPDDVRLKGWVTHLGRTELELKNLEKARPLLERAVRLREADGESPQTKAFDQLRLAKTLVEVEPERARSLAEQARRIFVDQVEQDGGREATHPTVLEWLDEAEALLGELPKDAPPP